MQAKQPTLNGYKLDYLLHLHYLLFKFIDRVLRQHRRHDCSQLPFPFSSRPGVERGTSVACPSEMRWPECDCRSATCLPITSPPD